MKSQFEEGGMGVLIGNQKCRCRIVAGGKKGGNLNRDGLHGEVLLYHPHTFKANATSVPKRIVKMMVNIWCINIFNSFSSTLVNIVNLGECVVLPMPLQKFHSTEASVLIKVDDLHISKQMKTRY